MDKILSLVDANFNRCKEGLRVVEDIFRFTARDDNLRSQARKYRHAMVKLVEPSLVEEAALRRNSKKDLGRKVDSLENKRKNVWEILYKNLQRAKESLRVLEEFSKLIDKKNTSKIKNLRYQIYDFEKKIILKRPSLCGNRRKNSKRIKPKNS